MKKRGKFLYQVIIHIILIGLVFGLFFLATMNNANSRNVKQQVLEKQTALLIDAAPDDTTLVIARKNEKGKITNFEIKNGRVFAYVDGQTYSKGYGYFSKFDVKVDEDDDNYYVKIGSDK